MKIYEFCFQKVLGLSEIRLSDCPKSCRKMSEKLLGPSRNPSRALFGQLDAFGRTKIEFLTSARPSVGQTNKFCPKEHLFFVKSWKKNTFFTNSYSKIVFSCILRNFGPGRTGPWPTFFGMGRAGPGPGKIFAEFSSLV